AFRLSSGSVRCSRSRAAHPCGREWPRSRQRSSLLLLQRPEYVARMTVQVGLLAWLAGPAAMEQLAEPVAEHAGENQRSKRVFLEGPSCVLARLRSLFACLPRHRLRRGGALLLAADAAEFGRARGAVFAHGLPPVRLVRQTSGQDGRCRSPWVCFPKLLYVLGL